MTKSELEAFAREQVALLQPKALDQGKASGQRAKGKLQFFEALVAAYDNTVTPEQFGQLDAVNDTFQKIGAFESGVTFFNDPGSCRK
ncbi:MULTISPECIES: hypothetical protein [Pseudomonas]|jgi:hypothetical protein|uniref:hypothetical protein n=1 Tax=Pseudomonas TaxID=286 RepID=UPI0018E61801|nr:MULTISPECIES: hypothetical protein [Pseudomonas]MBI6618811.1 hypothetical protein [Pseudomonas corrugata]MBI6690506.1 hypothetical protein [Pseudomonas corrugata]WRV66738.1 hypothetical protein VQ575_17835 [Pseudomonas frederiksbergensis]